MKNKSKYLSITSPTSERPCLDLDEIISYSGDEHSPNENSEIESHLRHCELCSEAIAGFRGSAGAPQFRQSVDDLHRAMHQKLAQKSIAKRNRRVYYAIAAMFVLALVSAFYLLQEKPLHERAYAQYFKIYPNTLPLVRGESTTNLFRQAMMEYELENYSNSLHILKQLLSRESGNETAHFYAGVCQLIAGQPEQAARHFEFILQNPNSKFSDPARWYFGLTLLKQGKIESAQDEFQSIPENSRFKNQSEGILSFLSSHE